MGESARVRDLYELRIHGVSGTSAASLLEWSDTVQVAGDRRSGFHRRRGWNGYGAAEAGDSRDGTRRHLEAFSWGGLTSGSASRAAWLLLLPFALLNVAAWAHPAPDVPGGRPWRGRARSLLFRVLRLLGLLLTLTLVNGAAGIALDLVAWQCAPSPECATGDNKLLRAVMPFLRDRAPGARLAFAAFVPLIVLALLWALGRWSYREYERIDPGTKAGEHADRTPFANASFWRVKSSITRLRSLHVAASLALVAALVSYPLRGNGARGVSIAAGVVAGLCALLTLTDATDVTREIDDGERARFGAAPMVLLVTAMDLVACALLLAAAAGEDVRRGGKLPGYGFALSAVAVATAGCVLAVFFATVVARKPRKGPVLRGLLPPVLAALAVALAAAFSSGLLYLAADLVATPPGQENSGGGTPPFQFRLHELTLGASIAALVAVGALLVAMAFLAGLQAFRYWDRGTRREREVRDDYRAGALGPEEGGVAGVAKARFFAGLTESGATVLAMFAIAVSLTGTGAIALALPHRAHARLTGTFSWQPFAVEDLALAGSRLVALLAVALVGIGVWAYRSNATRRSVGILWDLATFWPRAAHPLAPPCYCERTVPQLAARIAALAAQDSRVLVSAHSQGSVMVAAALLQLPDRTLDNVALVTHGSPLRRLYARAFPAYFHADLLALTGDRLTKAHVSRWRNCWRKTDFLGGPVGCPGVDVPVLDPPAHPPPCEPRGPHPALHRSSGDILPVEPLRHSNYYVTPEYNDAVVVLDGLLAGVPPLGVADERPAMTLPDAVS